MRRDPWRALCAYALAGGAVLAIMAGGGASAVQAMGALRSQGEQNLANHQDWVAKLPSKPLKHNEAWMRMAEGDRLPSNLL